MTSSRPEKNSTPEPCHLVFAIPARFGSTRLQGKPLQKIGGRTLVELVALRALECVAEARTRFSNALLEIHVVVATDHDQIADVASGTGVHVVMTQPELASGTDRINAALKTLSKTLPLPANTLVVNIQGDEPFFCKQDVLHLVQKMLHQNHIPMGTLAFKRNSTQMFLKSSVVKVVCNEGGEAIAFSRAPVPWPREQWGAAGHEWISLLGSLAIENSNEIDGDKQASQISFLHHIGIYAYRKLWLSKFSDELKPSLLEQTEGLEQLRALSAGWKILVVNAIEEPFGIDTAADLDAANLKWKIESEKQHS